MASRPIWTGNISFGLLNVPVRLYTGERKSDLHFRMLDSRDNVPVRYERVNSQTGEEVPWNEIVKGFEYKKGNYIILDKEELEKAGPEVPETVSVEGFVDRDAISPLFYEKPYYLVPGKKAEKGYVLFRETLERVGKVGIGHVVIRTREYLAMILPMGDALMLYLLRYPSEVVDADEFQFPAEDPGRYHISDKELQMAEQLVESMAMDWEPDRYQDRYRQRLMKIVEQRLAEKGEAEVVTEPEEAPGETATNVVDFMSLLRRSLEQKKDTPEEGVPAKKRTPKEGAAKAPKEKPPPKSRPKGRAKKAPAKKESARRRSG